VDGTWQQQGCDGARVAQSVERILGKDEVTGSIPVASFFQAQTSNEMPRDKIILECTECKNRNFFTDKNKRKHPERVERRKYCPRCDTHRVHKESK
jgi:large subunit ribosomal protein L33